MEMADWNLVSNIEFWAKIFIALVVLVIALRIMKGMDKKK